MSRLRQPKKHDDLLNFQLKRLFKLGGAPAVRLCEGRYGIARSEWRIVAALVEEGPLSPSALHACVGGDAGRISRVVADLVEKGLVIRHPNPSDKRRATLAAASSAKALYADIFPQLSRINERLMSVLSEREANLLEDFLERLTENARGIEEERGDGRDARADRRRGGARRVWSERTASARGTLAIDRLTAGYMRKR
jgi:DNA-binding MarR family transcriptional regulator